MPVAPFESKLHLPFVHQVIKGGGSNFTEARPRAHFVERFCSRRNTYLTVRRSATVQVHDGFSVKQQHICKADSRNRSEEHTSELQSLMRISYAVFCLKKTK